jgi:DNA-binding LacI/PurR family transcriptional regulator
LPPKPKDPGRSTAKGGQRRTPVTSVDVARAAGVSQSVVSRAFSLHPSVAAATRSQIFAVAEQLGYRPNLLARSLITRRTQLFAMVTGVLTNPLLLRVIECFTQAAQARGYRVLLFTAAPGSELDQAFRDVMQYQPDGVLALAGTPSPAVVAECRRSAIPVVLFGREAEDVAVPVVSCDNLAAGRAVAEFLLARGHRRFAFVTSRERTQSFSANRERGFTQVVQARLGTSVRVENGGSSYEGGYAAAKRLLKGRLRPDAIFCAGDAMALGVLDAATREYALAVPQELAVVGFDDVPMASWASYRLTTVRQPVAELVAAAMDVLLQEKDNPGAPPAARLLPGELVERGSTRASPVSRA